MIDLTPRARALAAAIRDLRHQHKLSSRELSERLGMSHSTVSHWETGRRVPTSEDVAGLLGAVGVNGEERKRILNLARRANEANWLTVGMPGVPAQLAGAMECERAADMITQWSPSLVPGLLQMPDYARAAISANDPFSSTDIESRVFVRAGRRDILTQRNPVRLHALIGEAALHEPIGSPEVMADQLHHLLVMAGRSSVTIQVMRPAQGWHPGLTGPFILYAFPDTPPVVHFEHHSSGAFVSEQKDVAAYKQAIDTISRKAMSPADSAQLIADLARETEHAP
jgi:transcriptional regulator with XRE-family HTH domain